MTDQRFVRPAPGRKVRQPIKGMPPLPEAGKVVDWSTYWERALQAGDVIEGQPTAPGAKPAPAPKPDAEAKGA